MPSECVVCGADASVSDACPHCGTACCPEHRPPEAHDCPGTDAGMTTGWRVDLDIGTSSEPADSGTSLSTLFRPGVGLAVVTLLLVVVALGAVATVGPLGGDLNTTAVEHDIVDRTNEERLAAGVGETAHDPELAAVARTHSRDMRDRGFVNHTNPDGEGPDDRVRAAGLDCLTGENIYQAPRGALASSAAALADHIVRAWMDSVGHRRTLLRDRYTRQGVGVAVGEDAIYVTQVFC
ncbi:MAG: hypothetical protein ACI8UR_001217 [Natronomonas sp.]|uniref:CAP domain-containing protein n=1 Tax=Natronomonas sp. TaxID=2184060 RepID=UPI00398A354B